MRISLVTGAGSGIGRAVALGFLQAGDAVILAGRRVDTLHETAALAGETAERILIVPTDVSDHQSVAALFTAIEERFGRLDVLFNNAGTGAPAMTVDEMSLTQWRTVVDVNLNGAFYCAREAFRMMRHQQPQGGRIINNGSISAHVPRPGSAAYTATKHAVTGLTRTLSLDGRAFNIACGQIDIGNADTAIAQPMRQGIRQATGDIRVEPVMDVAHAASAVLYMAGLPLEANVQFMTVMATTMPYIGRG
ncbi:MAG: SDR family oxidoreductase [Gammaproteobacteria bacterium]|nr:SDR family oxidoreductase [Gammaproteobacteria bacterium]